MEHSARPREMGRKDMRMPQPRQSEKSQTEERSTLSNANNGILPLPRFRADIIGSFIRPPELRAAQLEHRNRTKGSAHGQGKPASLVALEDQSRTSPR